MREAHNALRPSLSSRAGWIGLALLGLVVAAAVSVAASRLSSQQIGITSEPLSAGRELAPAAAAPAQNQTPPANAGQTGGGAGAQRDGHGPAGTHSSPQSPPQSTTDSTGESDSPGVEAGETGEGSAGDADD